MDPREYIKQLEHLKQQLLKQLPDKKTSRKYQKIDYLDRTLRMLYEEKRKLEKAGLI